MGPIATALVSDESHDDVESYLSGTRSVPFVFCARLWKSCMRRTRWNNFPADQRRGEVDRSVGVWQSATRPLRLIVHIAPRVMSSERLRRERKKEAGVQTPTTNRQKPRFRYTQLVIRADYFVSHVTGLSIILCQFCLCLNLDLKLSLFTQAFTEHWSDLPPAPLKLQPYDAI